MKKIIVLLIIVLIIGAYLIKSYNELDLKKSDDVKIFGKIYFKWVHNLVTNIRDITGYATKKEWLPENINSSNNNTN